MAGQLLTLPLRLWARGARVALHAAEDVTGLALTSTLRVAGAVANLRQRGSDVVPAGGMSTPPTRQRSAPEPRSGQEPRRSARRPSPSGQRTARPRPRRGAVKPRAEVTAEPRPDVTPDPRAEVAPGPRVEDREPPPAPVVGNGQLASERLEQEGATVAVHLDAPSSTEDPHVSEELTLAREEAEPGAEDGAGASITVREPWEGYRGASAKVVIARLGDASREELAAIQLFEGMNRNRRTVIEAAERELRSRPR